MEAVNQAFGANKVESKHEYPEAFSLLRQADCVLDEILKYIDDCTAYVKEQDGLLIQEAVREKNQKCLEVADAVPSCKVCRLRGQSHQTGGLHINQSFYPAMLRGIGVDLYLN